MRTPMLLAGLALAVGLLLPAGAVADAGGTDAVQRMGLRRHDVQPRNRGSPSRLDRHASHVGSFGFEQRGLLVPTGVGTFSSSFSWTMTAANGDRMFGTATGTATFTDAIHSTAVATYNVDRRDRAVRGRHAHLRRDGSKHPRRR